MSVRDIGHIYDEQFKQKVKLARILLKNLHDKKDVDLALKWLARASKIKSIIVEVKKNRNAFLSYMIKVLQDDVFKNMNHNSPTDCNMSNSMAYTGYSLQHKHTNLHMTKVPENFPSITSIKFHSKWSTDHSTYIAVKPIPGRGTLIYMAVSKKPGLQNWSAQ